MNDKLPGMSIQLIMTASMFEDSPKQLKQSRAVSRLLEVAEKHKVQEEEWNSSEKKEHMRSTKGHSSLPKKGSSYKEKRYFDEGEMPQKHIQRQRLKQLIKETIDNEEEVNEVKQAGRSMSNLKQMNLTVKFLRNTKLRPFNSNMTFQGMKQIHRQRYIASSLNFYKKQNPNSQFDKSHSFRFIHNQQLAEGRYSKKGKRGEGTPSKHVVYFRPNKSQTVRQLLNQMKSEKSKDNRVVLNSTERHFYEPPPPQQEPHQSMFSEQQLRVLSRYKKFIPFQKDESLLWRKMLDGDNIWLQRFRESWLKKKTDQKGRKSNFKKLIVQG